MMKVKKILDELGISEANVLDDTKEIESQENDVDETIVYDLEVIEHGKDE